MLYAVFFATVVLLVVGAWLAVGLRQVRHDLETARSALTAAQDRLAGADLDAARQQVSSAGQAAREAADRADGPPFRLYARLPFVGTGVQEVRSVAAAVDVTTNQVLPTVLNSDARLPTWNGRIDARPFIAAQRPLAQAQAQLTVVQDRLSRTPRSGISQLSKPRGELEASLRRLSGSIREARVASDVVPVLSGQDRPRRFLLAVQNNAEARATGGLLSSYAVLVADKGRLQLEHVGQNEELIDPAQAVLDLGEEYNRRYSRFQTTRTWRSANLTPDVPTVGRLLAALWREQQGQTLDGVVLLDPVALARVLAATGPVALSDGTQLNQANAVTVLESQVYARYPHADRTARYAFFAEAAERTFTALTSRRLDGRMVVREIGRAAASGHLQLWSADAHVQRTLSSSRVSGVLASEGPYLQVVTQDVGGSKLDYYLRRTVRYDGKSTGVATDLGKGPELEEEATVSVHLENRAPARGLPDYVVARPDDPRSPRGQMHSWLSVYLGARATLLEASLDGKPIAVESQTEQGLSVYSLFLRIDAGSSRTLVLKIRQPARPEQPVRYRQQPLVSIDDLQVHRAGSPRAVELVYAEP